MSPAGWEMVSLCLCWLVLVLVAVHVPPSRYPVQLTATANGLTGAAEG